MTQRKPRYGIGYIDMYDYGSTWTGPEYDSAAQALLHAYRVLDDILARELKAGMTADELYDRFMQFGEDVVIAAINGAPSLEFSGQKYVRRRCRELC
jgi:hypothetical protein